MCATGDGDGVQPDGGGPSASGCIRVSGEMDAGTARERIFCCGASGLTVMSWPQHQSLLRDIFADDKTGCSERFWDVTKNLSNQFC